MIRRGIGLVVVALAVLAGCAAAQAQPAPRVTLDVVVSPPAGLRPYAAGERGGLAVGADGTYYVLMSWYDEADAARIELVAIGPGGGAKMRVPLPVRLPIDSRGFAVQSMGVVVSRSGDLAVFVSGQGQTTLFRLGADGRIKKASEIAPPSRAARVGSDDYYQLRNYVATPDNALLLAGGYGSGPYSWWMGKFSLDGVRLWQQGPSRGWPDSVNALRLRSDGSWIVILEEHKILEERSSQKETHDCFLDRYAADGRRLARTRTDFKGCYAAAVLAEGSVIKTERRSPSQSELIFRDDTGKATHKTTWPFDDIDWMIADGLGLAAIVSPDADSKAVVRADANGRLRWKSPVVEKISDIARTPDGQIAALVWQAAPGEVRLVVYADP